MNSSHRVFLHSGCYAHVCVNIDDHVHSGSGRRVGLRELPLTGRRELLKLLASSSSALSVFEPSLLQCEDTRWSPDSPASGSEADWSNCPLVCRLSRWWLYGGAESRWRRRCWSSQWQEGGGGRCRSRPLQRGTPTWRNNRLQGTLWRWDHFLLVSLRLS